MCLQVYIGSKSPLLTVSYNEECPGFYVFEADKASKETVMHLMGSAFVYEAGSFMGCGCGLYFGNDTKDDDNGDHDLRVADVLLLKEYLKQNNRDNELKLFLTSWMNADVRNSVLNVNQINEGNYLLKEDVVYKVFTSL